MASRNKSILIVLGALVAISLLGAWLALNDSAASKRIADTAIEHATVASPARPAQEIDPVATTDVTAEPTFIPPPAADRLPLSPQRAAKLALRVDLQQIYYSYTGEVSGFEHMSDAQIFALLDELELRMKNGDTLAALEWHDLARAFCGKSVFFTADQEVPLDYNLAVLNQLPASETQFTKEFLLDFNTAELKQINARRHQCEAKTSKILTNPKSLENFLSGSGSVLGFLVGSEESLFAQIQLLGSTDQSELMALPEPFRARMAEQMIFDADGANYCEDVRAVLPYILHGTGPKILAMQADFVQFGCTSPLLNLPEPLKQLEHAAGFGDRTVINQYLQEILTSNADAFRIENAAWREFEMVLARSFCFGNQTMNVLASHYHDSDDLHSGLSVLEATEARNRSVELQATYLHQAKQHLGCLFGGP